MVTIGCYLGGYRIYAVALDGDEVRGEATLKTPSSGDRTAVLDVLAAAVHDAADAAGVAVADVGGVGIGTPGVVIDGTVGGASNVPGLLERFSLRDLLQQRIERPVRIVNDATAAVIAEHHLGAGRGIDDLLAVFVGTGVGGGLILGGRAYLGPAGGAGEFGHMIVQRGGAVCPCGRRGCVEAYAGVRALALAAERARAAGRPTILFDVQRELGAQSLDAEVLRVAFGRGDELAADLLDAAIEALGAGVASAVNLVDVDQVVLGGELPYRLGEGFRLRVDAAARPLLFLQPPRLRIVGAELGNRAEAIGAALSVA